MTFDYAPTPEEQEEFDARYRDAVSTEERVSVTYRGREIVWYPQAGSQTDFLQCPLLECLYHGTRGPGKSDGLLWSFAQHVGKGFGSAWRGVIFRQTYPQLADMVAKSEKWFRQVFPGARFNKAKMEWTWPTGEVLMFRHMAKPSDYWLYHGFELPFIGWEELTNWASDECYRQMFACSRSSMPGMPRMVRATTNPYGPGHSWVKERFNLHGRWWLTVIQMQPRDHLGNLEPPRCAIHGHIRENKILLAADPDYPQRIVASASSPEVMKAWMDGSWDIVAGGMFGDVWDPRHNVLPRFLPPAAWRRDRSFDWGSSHPFSIGWWAESDGSDVLIPGVGWKSTVRGDLFRFHEWYGWTGKPNEGIKLLGEAIARGIVKRELEWEIHKTVNPGPADTNIWTTERGGCTATDMEKQVRIDGKTYDGVSWTRADKRPGSRKVGWELVRRFMKAAHPREDGLPREIPGLYVMEHCDQFIRTVPSLPRSDLDMDDVDKKAEDHCGDETRYRVRASGMTVGSTSTVGMY